MKKYSNIIFPLILTGLVSLLLFNHLQNKQKLNLVSLDLKSPSNLIGSREKEWVTDGERRELCDKLGVVYSRSITFSEECLYLSNVNSNYLKFDIPVKRANPERAEYLKKCIAKEYQAPIYVKWVDDVVGYGVFAKVNIHKDDYIMEYGGRVIEFADDTTYAWSYPCIPGGFGFEKKRYMIDGRLVGNESRFVNDPLNEDAVNIKLGLIHCNGAYHNIYIASKDIKAGEQLFISYGDDYWKVRNGEVLNR